MTYSKYLKSNHWKDKKTEIYKKQMCRKCAVCGSNKNLNIHHISYKNLGKERAKDLLVLCNSCHEKYHAGLIDEKTLAFVSKHREMFNQPRENTKLTRKQRLRRWKRKQRK